MKIIISLIMVVLMCSLVMATVTRTGSENTITYSSNMATTYPKAYWAVYEVVPSGCTVSSVSCSVSNGCSYVSADKSIRVTGYTAEAGGSMPPSITVTVSGTGSCLLNNGDYVESYNTGTQAVTGSLTDISGSISMSLGGGSCNTEADTNCDGCVSDPEFPVSVVNWKQQTGC